MARIRTLKPEFWSDEKLARCDPKTRLVFLGLISQADDAGRLVDNLKLIDGLLFPATDDSAADSLDLLARLGRIVRYTAPNGQRVIQIVHWERHQRIQHPGKNVLPPPPAELLAAAQQAGASGESHETLMRVSGESREDLRRVSGESHEDLTRSSGESHESLTPDLGPRTVGPRTMEISDASHPAAAPPRVVHTAAENSAAEGVSPPEAATSTALGGDDPFEEPEPPPLAEPEQRRALARLMGVLRSQGFACDRTDGSIVKALLGKGVGEEEIEAAARGLRVLAERGDLAEAYRVQPGGQLSMRILYARGKRPVWTDAVAAWHAEELRAGASARSVRSGGRPVALADVLAAALGGARDPPS